MARNGEVSIDSKCQKTQLDENITEDKDFDINIEFDFVGRDNDLEQIKQAWSKNKIFGFFGLRSVGKSRLAREAIKRYKRNAELIEVDVKLIHDTESLYSNLCAALKVEPENYAYATDRWIHHLVGSLLKTNSKHFVFFFDNTEDYQEFKGVNVRDSFLSLCTSLMKRCNNVKIVVTSTTRIQLSQLKRAYFSYEVLPLNTHETRRLLKSVAEGVDFGEYEEAIVTLSEGLPLLVVMIGSELTEDSGMITPKDMVEFLLERRLKALSREYYPEEDRVADVYKKFIDRLDKVYRRRLTTLEYIPGSFTAEQAKGILGLPSTAMTKDEALIPIRRRHILNYNAATRRFNIQGILRECIKAYYTIKNLPDIRARYCEVFSDVMQKISKQLGTVEYTTALAEFTLEQPNLQKLINEVTYTRADTYHFFIQMATNCTELIERFMAGEGEKFYEGCLRAADMYGQDRDRASVNLAVGSMYTNTMGNLIRGAEKYEDALMVLQKDGKSLPLATAYQRIGWNMLQQGKNIEAIGYFKKSLGISQVSGPEYQTIFLQSMNSMGVTLTVLGKFDEAERYHTASLKKRLQIQGPDHPGVGACYNNIGIMYDQKGDSQKALEYYQKGLQIKMKSNAPVSALVLSISNTANMCTANNQFEEAHKMLDDAFDKINKEKIAPREPLACLYDTKGKAYRKEGKLKEAEEMFRKAVEIRAEVAPDNVPYLESLVHCADINKKLGKFDDSLEFAKKALKLKDKAIKAMPQNSFVAECLQCIGEVYEKTNNTEKYKETLEKIESELIRLEQVYLCNCNESALERIRKQLAEVRDRLNSMGNKGSKDNDNIDHMETFV